MPETDSKTEAEQTTETQSETDESTVDWKAKARDWEKRSKQNAARIAELEPKASQYDALEQASKSELDLARETSATLQKELESTQREALVASVALDKGLPANLARRLQGGSREELEADADELLSQFGTTNTTRAPAPDRSQGSSANNGASADPAQQFAAILRGQLGS